MQRGFAGKSFLGRVGKAWLEDLAVPRMASVWSCDSGCLFSGLSGLGSLVPFLTAQGDARRKHRLLCVERFMMSLHLHSNHEVGQWVILDNRVSTHAISSDPHK